jgi:glycosyltransferase involved in cell wall biosynthesis
VYERGWLERLLVEHGVRHRVVCTGELPSAEVAAAYACADVFAFASRTDTQGLVLQEAALAGLPVVLVDEALHAHGALGGAAWCVEPTEHALGGALLRVLREPSLAVRIARAARACALEHTPDRYAAAMARIYSSAASGWSAGVAA